MAFTRLTSLNYWRGKGGCTVRLDKRGEKAYCVVIIRRDLMEALDINERSRFHVEIGADDDLGVLRLIPDPLGVAEAVSIQNAKCISIRLGHISQFPNRVEASQGCPAEDDGEGAIEITLPSWSREAAPRQEDQQKTAAPAMPKSEPLSPPAVPTKSAAAPQAKPNGGGNGVHHVALHGVRVDLTPEEENVEHGGKVMELTARQAQFLAALLRGYPNPIDRNFIRQKVCAGTGSQADAMLDMIYGDLSKAVADIGLHVKAIKGVGFSLERLDA